MAQLEDGLAAVHIAELDLAQGSEGDPIGDPAPSHLAGGVRAQHLPAVGGGAQPLGLMDRQPGVAVGRDDRFARMDADADTELGPRWPRLPGEQSLDVDGGGEGIAGPVEHHKERVTLGTGDVAAMPGERTGEQVAVTLEDET